MSLGIGDRDREFLFEVLEGLGHSAVLLEQVGIERCLEFRADGRTVRLIDQDARFGGAALDEGTNGFTGRRAPMSRLRWLPFRVAANLSS